MTTPIVLTFPKMYELNNLANQTTQSYGASKLTINKPIKSH